MDRRNNGARWGWGVSSVWGLIWEFGQYNCVSGLILSCIKPRLARGLTTLSAAILSLSGPNQICPGQPGIGRDRPRRVDYSNDKERNLWVCLGHFLCSRIVFFSPNLKCLPSVLIFPSLTHCHTVKAARVRQAEKRSRRKPVKKGDGERWQWENKTGTDV